MLKSRLINFSIALIIVISTIGMNSLYLNNLEAYAQGSKNGTVNNISKAAPMANVSNNNATDIEEIITIEDLGNDTIPFPVNSITLILDAVDKANAALSDGDNDEVSQQLHNIEAEVRDQLGNLGIQMNDNSPDEIDDVLVEKQ
jgi:hypothetical protein